MGLVNLVSGGLDSTLVAVMAKEEGIPQHPLFIDYGQICADREWETCLAIHRKWNLPEPVAMNLSGFGHVIRSGLTDRSLDIAKQAFLPGRNALFLLAGYSYAIQKNANAVAIGLLSEEHSLFPDQTIGFVEQMESFMTTATGKHIHIVTPLSKFTKGQVLELARRKGIDGTYSCHAGNETPCGECVSCLEVIRARVSSQPDH